MSRHTYYIPVTTPGVMKIVVDQNQAAVSPEIVFGVRGVDLYGVIDPRDVVAYAVERGWVLKPADGRHQDRLLVLHRADDPHQQLVVPTEPSFDDFTRRMVDAVAKLAEFEGRTPMAIMTDLGE